MSHAEFAVALPKLGPDANEGDVIYLMVVHAHEMLGQSIPILVRWEWFRLGLPQL